MGKGDKRGKAHPKPRPAGIPALEVKDGGPKRVGRPKGPKESEVRLALDLRCREFGIAACEDSRRLLAGPHGGSPIGLVLLRFCSTLDEVTRIWQVWQGFCAAERTYRLRYLGQSGGAKGAAVQMVPGRVETEGGGSIDARTPDEKDRDAIGNWMRWRGYVGCLSSKEQVVLHAAERGDGPILWLERAPTAAGAETCRALVRLSMQVEAAALRKKKG